MCSKNIETKALQYLLEKRKSKGSKINYNKLEMKTYLSSDNNLLSIADKKLIFNVRNRMINFKRNFKNEKNKNLNICIADCYSELSEQHIYECMKLNNNINNNIDFEKNIQWKHF